MKHPSAWTRSLVLTIAAAAACVGLAVAQTPPTEPPSAPPSAPSNPPPPPSEGKIQERIDHRLQMLTEKLTLTAAQQSQVKSILENDAQSAEAIHQNTGLSEEQKKAQFKSLQEASHSQINALLTPQHQQIFSKMHGHHHPQQPPEQE